MPIPELGCRYAQEDKVLILRTLRSYKQALYSLNYSANHPLLQGAALKDLGAICVQ